MPQLDKLSFNVQIFWFIIFFVISYAFLRYSVLPTILYSLRLRQKTLDNLFFNINNVIVESFLLEKRFFNNFMSRKRIFDIFNFFQDFDFNLNKYAKKTVEDKVRE